MAVFPDKKRGVLRHSDGLPPGRGVGTYPARGIRGKDGEEGHSLGPREGMTENLGEDREEVTGRAGTGDDERGAR